MTVETAQLVEHDRRTRGEDLDGVSMGVLERAHRVRGILKESDLDESIRSGVKGNGPKGMMAQHTCDLTTRRDVTRSHMYDAYNVQCARHSRASNAMRE